MLRPTKPLRTALAISAPILTAATLLSSNPAHAISTTVTIDGFNYTITTFTGSYDATLFTTNKMPWWSNPQNVDTFITAVGTRLGFPNYNGFGGPFFATSVSGTDITSRYLVQTTGAISNNTTPTFVSYTYAILENDPTPVPGPLPVFGALAAFSWSRKLRSKLKITSSITKSNQ